MKRMTGLRASCLNDLSGNCSWQGTGTWNNILAIFAAYISDSYAVLLLLLCQCTVDQPNRQPGCHSSWGLLPGQGPGLLPGHADDKP
jgi:hypothetical protein